MTHLHTIKNAKAENRVLFRGNFKFLRIVKKKINSLDRNKAPGVKIYNLFIKQIGFFGTKLTKDYQISPRDDEPENYMKLYGSFSKERESKIYVTALE